MDNESLWLDKALEGDDAAFAEIVGSYQRPVFNLCYRMLGNPNDAEDAAQETFLRAYKALERYDRNRAFSTWILSIASHYCIDQLRKRRYQTYSLDDEDRAWFQPPDPGPTPDKAVGDKEKHEFIRSLLDELSPKDRAAVVLRYWYDYSYDEISETLNLTNSAVKSRLHRARKQLALEYQTQKPQTILSTERTQNESPAF